jgi:hypothetical protein
MKKESLKIIAQMTGYKNLKIEGGFRLQLDIFEAREQDVAALALLVNRRQVVSVTFQPQKDEDNGN